MTRVLTLLAAIESWPWLAVLHFLGGLSYGG